MWFEGFESGAWAAVAVLACVPPLALAIDAVWGEPPAPVHPVVWMGRALGWCGERVAPLSPQARDFKHFWLGAFAWCALAAIVLIVS
ncbi:MAG: cobalamin biosynthesis protein, partial [Paenacidovorax caeni]